MRINRNIILWCSFLCLATVFVFSCEEKYQDYSTPVKTFETFVEAAKREDMETYISCIDHERATKGMSRKEVKQYREKYKERILSHAQMIKGIEYTPLEEKMEGDTAHLWVEYTMQDSQGLYRYWFHFVKREEGWKIIFK